MVAVGADNLRVMQQQAAHCSRASFAYSNEHQIGKLLEGFEAGLRLGGTNLYWWDAWGYEQTSKYWRVQYLLSRTGSFPNSLLHERDARP